MIDADFLLRDCRVRFQENALNVGVQLYQVEFKCADETITKIVSADEFQSKDVDDLRNYASTMLFSENVAAGLTRDVEITIKTKGADGKFAEEAEWLVVDAHNPPPEQCNVEASASVDGAVVRITPHATSTDIVGYLVWVSDTPGIDVESDPPTYDQRDGLFDLVIPDFAPRYIRAAAYDSFGKDALNPSVEISFTKAGVTLEDIEDDVNEIIAPLIEEVQASITASTAALNAELDTLDGTISSLSDAFDETNSTVGEHGERIGTLETASSGQATRLDLLEVAVGDEEEPEGTSLRGRIASLQQTTTDLSTGKVDTSVVTALESKVNLKNRVFRQTSSPSNPSGGLPLVTGDLWMDTDDDDQLYSWNGAAWVAHADANGEAALNELIGARGAYSTIGARLGTFTGTLTDALAGKASASDLSTLTTEVTTARGSAGSLSGRFTNLVSDIAGKASSSSVTTLQSQVALKNRVFVQTSAPSNPSDGLALIANDLWADSDDNHELYRWNGSAWVAAGDLRGEAALAEITAARGGAANLNARIDTMNTTLTDAIALKASTTSLNALSAEIVAARDGQVSLAAKFAAVNTAMVDGLAGKASTSSVSSLSATVGDHTSSISTLQSTTASIDGAVDAKVGLVLNVNGKISGFSSVNNGTTSTFDVQADVFRLTAGSSAVSPFTVADGKVYASEVVLRNAASGERTEVSKYGMKVVDSSGVTRVKIGLLSSL